jgi:hypothetical protein
MASACRTLTRRNRALELRGASRLLGRVAVPRVRDAVAANLRKLKELLER